MKFPNFFRLDFKHEKSANASHTLTTPQGSVRNPDFAETLPSDDPIVRAQAEKEREHSIIPDIRATELYNEIQRAKEKRMKAKAEGNAARERELTRIQETLEARLNILNAEGYIEINENTSTETIRKAITTLTSRLGSEFDQTRIRETLALLQDKIAQREVDAQNARIDTQIRILLQRQKTLPLTPIEAQKLEALIEEKATLFRSTSKKDALREAA